MCERTEKKANVYHNHHKCDGRCNVTANLTSSLKYIIRVNGFTLEKKG